MLLLMFPKQCKMTEFYKFATLARLLVLVVLFLSITACSQEKGKKLAVGDSAPGFSLQTLDGDNISLSEMQGSPVLIRFFLTDCKYCRADTPIFNEFYTRYKDKGLGVFYIDSLGVDTKVVRSFVKELGILFPVAQDRGGEVTAKYLVRALPQTIVLDPEHKITAAILGGVAEQELSQLLSPYFNE